MKLITLALLITGCTNTTQTVRHTIYQPSWVHVGYTSSIVNHLGDE